MFAIKADHGNTIKMIFNANFNGGFMGGRVKKKVLNWAPFF